MGFRRGSRSSRKASAAEDNWLEAEKARVSQQQKAVEEKEQRRIAIKQARKDERRKQINQRRAMRIAERNPRPIPKSDGRLALGVRLTNLILLQKRGEFLQSQPIVIEICE